MAATEVGKIGLAVVIESEKCDVASVHRVILVDDGVNICHIIPLWVINRMGTLHQLPTAAALHARSLEQLVTKSIASHPDPEVARLWSGMARETLSRFSSPPLPSQPILDLDELSDLSSVQTEQLHNITQTWMENYLVDVRNQLMAIHGELLKLQKQVAELTVETKPN